MKTKKILNNGFIQLLILWLSLCSIIIGFLTYVGSEDTYSLAFNGGLFIATFLTLDGLILQIGDSLDKWIQKRALRSYLQRMAGGD